MRRTSLADTGSVQVAVGSQESTFSVRPTVLYTGADEHLGHHRHQRGVTAVSAARTTQKTKSRVT